MDLKVPELVDCSDELDSALLEDYYDYLNSCPSTISVHTINDEDFGQQFKNGGVIKNNKITTVKNSNLKSMISLLDFQASSLSDPRQFVTTLWNFEFDTTMKMFRFSITDLSDGESTGFQFVTTSVKLPRNKPSKWEHFITNTTYMQLEASFNFEPISPPQPMTPFRVRREAEEILQRVWILDGGEVEGVMHTMNGILAENVH